MFRNLTSPKVRPELPIAVSVATDDVFAAIAVKDSLSWDKQNGPKKNGYDHQQSTSINKHQRPIQQEPNCTQHTRVETCRQQPTTRKVCKKKAIKLQPKYPFGSPCHPLAYWPMEVSLSLFLSLCLCGLSLSLCLCRLCHPSHLSDLCFAMVVVCGFGPAPACLQ